MTGRSTRQLQDALLAEILAELRAERANSTEAFAQFRSSITNDVLDSGSYVLDANGLITQSYQTPYGSIFVTNLGNGDLTVTSSPPGAGAPPKGRGVHIVPAHSAALLDLAGTAWTIYGDVGDLVDVQAFSRPWPPAATGTLARSSPLQTTTQLTLTGTDPAAGGEISQTVPAGESWRVLAVRFTLVASAVVANRRVNIAIDDGSSVFAKIGAPNAQTAGQTIGYSYGVGYPYTQPSDMVSPLPELLLPAGYRIRTITDLLDAGDNYSAPVIFYERVS